MTLAEWMKYLGGKVRKARESAGMSQDELNELIGLPAGYIGKTERGLRSPSWATRRRITMALGLPEDEFEEVPADSERKP